MSELERLQDAMTALRRVDTGSLAWEIERLGREAQWAREQLPVQAGDRVTIAEQVPTNNGWASHREALAVGATGVARRVYLSSTSSVWRADFVPDRCWSELDGTRYWHGAADETPDGHNPPSAYDQERYPEGRGHVFSFPLEWLGRISATDEGTTNG